MPFSDDIKTRVLLWCDRHCCLCKKACGINIEVHHIVPQSEGGTDDIDNAIPLCFDCHGLVGQYNPGHPKGNKFKEDEVKARRDQVYDEYTRHLVPPISYEIVNHPTPFPTVGFNLFHRGASLPVRVRVLVECVKDDGTTLKMDGHYGGSELWNMNPLHEISGGHFVLSDEYLQSVSRAKLRLSISIIDQYEREHYYLPIEYIFAKDTKIWFLDP